MSGNPTRIAPPKFDQRNEQHTRSSVETRLRGVESLLDNEVRLFKADLTLVNGANANVELPSVARYLRITGPSGAFSMSGFADGYEGKRLVLYNDTAQTLTITNDATSTAANRILTLTGADVSINGPGLAFFIYSVDELRWLLEGYGGAGTGSFSSLTTTTLVVTTSATVGGSAVKTVGKETVCIPANAWTIGASGSPSRGSVEVAAGLNYLPTLDFDGAGSAKEYAYFQIAMPKGWNEGTLTYQVYWCSSATDTDGVVWGLQAMAISDNEALNGTFGAAIEVTDNAQSAANELLTAAESAALTVNGTPAVGDLVLFRLYRDPAHASDTHAEDARLIQMKLFLTTDAATDA
jgi:hypothetical protein